MENKSIIQKAFDITKDNIILAQPLVLYLLAASFTFAGLAMQSNKYTYVIFLITNILLFTAFLAGWFSMIKQGILLNRRIENGEFQKAEDRAAASWDLGKAFFPGVGDYFLQVTLTTLAYVTFFILLTYAFFKLGQNYLPHHVLDLQKINTLANSSPAEIQKFVYSLSFEQLKAINIWMLYLGSVAFGYTFITLFWFPAIFDSKETFWLAPIKSFSRNIVFLFKNFLGSLGVILFLLMLNTFISILSVIFNLNVVLAIVGLIISFYFTTYAVVLIFLYYDERRKN